MKKHVILFILSCVCLLSSAQTQHVVRRGETPQSIANKYNITVDQLFDANPATRGYIHVGLPLSIPQKEAPQSVISSESNTNLQPEKTNTSDLIADLDKSLKELSNYLENQKIINHYWEQASSAFEREDYIEAERYYSKVIELNSKDADAYFNIGACFYNRGKYKQARENFYTSYTLYPNGDSKERARELYIESEQLQREKTQRAWSVAAGLALAVAGTAVAVSETKQMSSAQQPYGYNPVYQSTYSSMPNTFSSSQYPETAALQAYSNQLLESSMREINKTNELSLITSSVLMENGVEPSSIDDQSKLQASFVNKYKQSYGINPSQQEIQKFFYDYRLMKYGVVVNSSDEDENGTDDQITMTTKTNDYQADYDFYEKLVKNGFNSVVAVGGVAIKEDTKETRVYADSHAPGGVNLSLYSQINNNQKKMAEIRHEAMLNGVTIVKSEWESKPLNHF